MRNSYLLYQELAASGLLSSGRSDGFRYVSSLGKAWPDIIYREDPVPVDADLELPALTALIRSGAAPRLIIMDDRLITPAVSAGLAAQRCIPATQWLNMSLQLGGTDERPAVEGLEPTVEGLEFGVLSPGQADGRKDWTAVAESVLFPRTRFDEKLIDYIISNDICRLVTAYYNSQPVATTMLYKGEMAGIYMVATLPAFRGRGFARATMLFTQALAAGLKYRNVVLQSTQAGLQLYQSLGYTPLEKMSLYYCMI